MLEDAVLDLNRLGWLVFLRVLARGPVAERARERTRDDVVVVARGLDRTRHPDVVFLDDEVLAALVEVGDDDFRVPGAEAVPRPRAPPGKCTVMAYSGPWSGRPAKQLTVVTPLAGAIPTEYPCSWVPPWLNRICERITTVSVA